MQTKFKLENNQWTQTHGHTHTEESESLRREFILKHSESTQRFFKPRAVNLLTSPSLDNKNVNE